MPEVISVLGFASRNVKFFPKVWKAERRMVDPRRIAARDMTVRGPHLKREGLRLVVLGQRRAGGDGYVRLMSAWRTPNATSMDERMKREDRLTANLILSGFFES